MRGLGARNIVAENLHAATPHQDTKKDMARRLRMCWKCQKDKSTFGGHLKTWLGGPMKFICKECVEAKTLKGAA